MPDRPPSLKPRSWKPKAERRKEFDNERGTSASRGYGYKWQQQRRTYLQKHPLCVHCEDKGIITAAIELDHIVPHKGSKELFWDNTNWQGLCKPCHSRKTATEDSSFARTPPP